MILISFPLPGVSQHLMSDCSIIAADTEDGADILTGILGGRDLQPIDVVLETVEKNPGSTVPPTRYIHGDGNSVWLDPTRMMA